MTLIRPTTPQAGTAGPDARAGAGRIAAVLVLVLLGALIPMLGPSLALDGTGEAAAPGDEGIGLLRTVLFTALAVPAGELFIRRLARAVPGPLPAFPASWSPWAAVAALVAALGLASVVATGNLVPRSLSDIDVGGLYAFRDGKLALLEVNAFLALALLARSARPAHQVWPMAAVVVAEALRAHPTTEYSPLIGSGLTAVHLTCSSLWVGGLLYALRILRAWRHAPDGDGRTAAAVVLARYARVAALLLAALTATGVCSSLRRMPPETILQQLTDTAYGRVLFAKVLLVAVIALLALWARRRLHHASDPLTAYAPARAEVICLGLAVAVSGLLTAVPVPIRW